MKKLLLGASMVALSIGANAQLANGSQAPDFTITDINGNTHTLSDYMAAGKTVIMDISATWCSPCWGFHQTHALEEIYQTYGPEGSDEVVVLFVEGDNGTGLAELQGSGNTLGNWIEGTSYPIIDNGGSIASDYEIEGYPTLFSICPDGNGGGTTYNFVFNSEFNRPDILTKINECSAVNGVANNLSLDNGAVGLCSLEATDITLSFKNYGTAAATSGTVRLLEDGVEISTTSISGSTASYESGEVVFTGVNVDPSKTYTAELVDVNGGTNNSASTSNIEILSPELSSIYVTVKFFTDNYPSETSWQLVDENNNVVAEAGPFTPGTDDQFGGGGPDALTTKDTSFVLPTGDHCYSVKLIDALNDGQQYGTGENNGGHGIAIESGGSEIFNWDPGSGFSTIERGAAINTDATSGVSENTIENVNVYPNPATDVLTVSFEANNADYTVLLTDLAGRTLTSNTLTSLSGAQSISLPVAELANGNYILTISSEEGSYTQKVVIK